MRTRTPAHRDAVGLDPDAGHRGHVRCSRRDTFGLPIQINPATARLPTRRSCSKVCGSQQGQKIFNEKKGSISARLDVLYSRERQPAPDLRGLPRRQKDLSGNRRSWRSRATWTPSARRSRTSPETGRRHRQRGPAHAEQLPRPAAGQLLAEVPVADRQSTICGLVVHWTTAVRSRPTGPGAARADWRPARRLPTRHRRMATLSIDCPLWPPANTTTRPSCAARSPSRLVRSRPELGWTTRRGRTSSWSAGGRPSGSAPGAQVRISRPRGVAPARRAGADRARHLGARPRQPQRDVRRRTCRSAAALLPDGARHARRADRPGAALPARSRARRAVAGAALRRPDRREHADARAVRADVARRADATRRC